MKKLNKDACADEIMFTHPLFTLKYINSYVNVQLNRHKISRSSSPSSVLSDAVTSGLESIFFQQFAVKNGLSGRTTLSGAQLTAQKRDFGREIDP